MTTNQQDEGLESDKNKPCGLFSGIDLRFMDFCPKFLVNEFDTFWKLTKPWLFSSVPSQK